MAADPRFIRNFSIIAHIDHGKSTLADRILDATGARSEREKKEQWLNKIDLPSADVEGTKKQIEDVIGMDASDALLASAKTGIGIHEILEAVTTRISPPKGDPAAPLQALIFDSWYDTYKGVVTLVRVVNGTLKKGLKIRLLATQKDFEVLAVGAFSPHPEELEDLSVGEVGFIIANIKQVADTKIGDTI